MRKLAVSLYLALAAAPALAAPDYTLTLLGTDNAIFALNNAGVGVGIDAYSVARTFTKDGIGAVPLPASVSPSYAYGINDANTIVGQAGGYPDGRAYAIQGGVYRELTYRGFASLARDVNNAGTVVVNYVADGGLPGSYLWSESGGVVDLGGLSANAPTEALAINDRGQVVGQSLDTNGQFQPFLWENGTMTDLSGYGVRGEFGVNLGGISEQGAVFGAKVDSDGFRAWVIRDGEVDWYNDLTRIAYIDGRGRVFGVDQQNNAVIVDGETTTLISDLFPGQPGWWFQLDAVNENGDILTAACRANDCHTVLLTAVPEPSTYAMLLLGGLATGLYARRRR